MAINYLIHLTNLTTPRDEEGWGEEEEEEEDPNRDIERQITN